MEKILKSGSGGYKYFGAAKDLPGVRDLFQQEAPIAPKKSRNDLYKNINYEYYGLKDDKNLEMVAEEVEYEKKLFQQSVSTWIDQNQEYIRTKLIGVKNPSTDQILSLIDDEDYEEFKKEYESGIWKKCIIEI